MSDVDTNNGNTGSQPSDTLTVDRMRAEMARRPPMSTRRQKLLRLAAQGVNARRASELIGVGYQTVLKEYQDREFRKQVFLLVESAFHDVDAKFDEVQLSLHDRIRLKSEEAFTTLCTLLDNDATDERLRAKIAMDFLDRNPETQGGHTLRTGELVEAQSLAAAARVAEEMVGVIPITKKVANG